LRRRGRRDFGAGAFDRFAFAAFASTSRRCALLASASQRSPCRLSFATFSGSRSVPAQVRQSRAIKNSSRCRGPDPEAVIQQSMLEVHNRPRHGLLAAVHLMKPIEAAVFGLRAKTSNGSTYLCPGHRRRFPSSRLGRGAVLVSNCRGSSTPKMRCPDPQRNTNPCKPSKCARADAWLHEVVLPSPWAASLLQGVNRRISRPSRRAKRTVDQVPDRSCSTASSGAAIRSAVSRTMSLLRTR
jgi:hypothetical protein